MMRSQLPLAALSAGGFGGGHAAYRMATAAQKLFQRGARLFVVFDQ